MDFKSWIFFVFLALTSYVEEIAEEKLKLGGECYIGKTEFWVVLGSYSPLYGVGGFR